MNDEVKTEEHEKTWRERLSDAALEVNDFGAGLRTISMAIKEQAPKVIDDLADVVIHGCKRADEIREIRYGRLSEFAHDLKQNSKLDSKHAAYIVREVISREADRERLLIDGIGYAVRQVVERVVPGVISKIADAAAATLEKAVCDKFAKAVEEKIDQGV